MATRIYHVIAVNDKTGAKVYLTARPEPHHSACVILNKQSKPHQDVRKLLEEVTE